MYKMTDIGLKTIYPTNIKIYFHDNINIMI